MLETNSLIVIVVIGLIAGWLAGQIMKGGGFGLIGDLIVGIIGAVIGGWLWATLHLPMLGAWWITAIVSAVIGACILLYVIRLIKR
ncbi:MAG: GlsB/YeaQ/YmgE family stress response membrane protein [Pseudolabrys sp.]